MYSGFFGVLLISPRMKMAQISEQPVLLFNHYHSNKVFPMCKWSLQYFILCWLPLVLSLATSEKSLLHVLYSLHNPCQMFVHMNKISLSLLQAEQSKLSQPLPIWQMLQSLHFSGSSLDYLKYVHVCHVLGNPNSYPEMSRSMYISCKTHFGMRHQSALFHGRCYVFS